MMCITQQHHKPVRYHRMLGCIRQFLIDLIRHQYSFDFHQAHCVMGYQCYIFELPQMQLDLSFSVLELQRHDELFLHLHQELPHDNTVIL